MPQDDDVDFAAYMRARGVERMGAGHPAERHPKTGPSSTPPPHGEAEVRAAVQQRDSAQRTLADLRAEHQKTRQALALARQQAEARGAELDALRGTLDQTEQQRTALRKECVALQRRLSASTPAPEPNPDLPSLRQVLAERGIDDDAEATDAVLAVLGRDPAGLLDALMVPPALAASLSDQLVLVCDRPECQPPDSAVVLRVPASRCEVCGGSDIRAAFEALRRSSRVAGVTRLVIVGGSPAYRTQLRELSRGTDLKLDLVSGRRKPGRRRARNDVERVVIWGSTILDHGTTAAYDHLGDRLIRVTHRGISGMLHAVARALDGS